MAGLVISIIGCGWLGLPLAERLRADEYAVKGSTTSSDKIPMLAEKGIEAYQLQLAPHPVGNLHDLLRTDTLLIDVPPKAGKLGDDFHPQQMQHLVNAVQSSPVTHVIYVSSTSVYPELSRTLVEEDVTEPSHSAAPALVQAEQLFTKLAPERIVTVLRCGGLMGYNRIPGKYVAGRTVDSGAVPVNYLHRDDAVEILTNLIRQKTSGTFNAVAPEHPTREAIYRKSCADFDCALPVFIQPAEPKPFKSISSAKLIQQTEYAFRYPNPLDFLYS
ncbi:SDR family NAD(P)-dependent oxidoreductase [Spirosoma taeanense]|uniref:SDR family NAD(P)-dependent oxidoreductase n=1 Tax=Spirosoma taeanense TaxID=2735870 RepID=A0A6M5YE21_9BACT|nr:SDR family NAD(P)-dependent oxidoreductase [Spirosoma taeanense]QJW91844.1 SDR family NAD(P)-dependent oxidoreductase [Spirosoma taeanense]